MNDPPTFWLIAGPNGVGKTTYAMRHLKAVSGSVHFVNLDEIARGLSPLDPSAAQTDAARIALKRARDFIQARQTFAMETTASGLTHLGLVAAAHRAGLRTSMLYFSVNDHRLCLERIARRVAEGGHDVPSEIVERRFHRSHANLPAYARLMDVWRIYEASTSRPVLALEGRRDLLSHADGAMVAVAHPAVSSLAASLQAGR